MVAAPTYDYPHIPHVRTAKARSRRGAFERPGPVRLEGSQAILTMISVTGVFCLDKNIWNAVQRITIHGRRYIDASVG
jgi:hypothetical protein